MEDEFRKLEESLRLIHQTHPLAMTIVHGSNENEAELASKLGQLAPLKPHEIETYKLRANYLNGLAIALFAVGALAPIVKVLDAGSTSVGATAAVAVICVSLSFALHLSAVIVLKGLR